MPEIIKGLLVVISTKQGPALRVTFPTKKGTSIPTQIPLGHLHPNLEAESQQNLQGLNNREVDLELEGGQPRRIRPVGEAWANESANMVATNQDANAFHNPYNFIPAPPRNTAHPELGDRSPIGHDRYYDNYWSGKITCILTTITPLLIPDAANLQENQDTKHKTYDLRRVNGKPYLPPTSIKGMLRNAYEAITNSRFGVFEEHGDRLAYRMPIDIGLEMVPARIEKNREGRLIIRLYPGESQIGKNGNPINNVMYAAWLPRYNPNNDKLSPFATKYEGSKALPSHGDKVTVWLEQYEKTRKRKDDGRIIKIFTHWRVRKIVRHGDSLGLQPIGGQPSGRYRPTTGQKMIERDGFVCVTNKNIGGKHDERVFFSTGNQNLEIELTDELKKKWSELIANYQKTHQDEIKKGLKCPPALNHSHWSRHIVGGEQEKSLSDGTLCYAHVRKNGNDCEVLDLYPVMIPRGLFQKSPADLLPNELKPATRIQELSPADRIFGWVNQQGSGAYKGQLRISAVECKCKIEEGASAVECKTEKGASAIADFSPDGVPLAILGQPKPQQARFYVARNQEGKPLDKGMPKEAGFKENHHLRGRKVYPHHKGTKERGDWKDPMEDRALPEGAHREYRRPKLQGQEQRDDQNRSIKAWVEPDVEFQFEIDVVNLSNLELGALLYLLQLPESHYHRLGGGKPLGFGSVEIKITETDLRTGQKWQEFYRSLKNEEKPEQTQTLNCVEAFKDAVKTAYKTSKFDKVSFVEAFLKSAQGFDDGKPIHYPRLQPNPDPNGKNFKWFTANESTDGFKLSLPLLVEDGGLRYVPNIEEEQV